MAHTAEELLIAARTLPEAGRLELAEALLAEASPAPEPTGDAWLAELRRRTAEIDAGVATGTPWEEVRRRAVLAPSPPKWGRGGKNRPPHAGLGISPAIDLHTVGPPCPSSTTSAPR